MEEEIDKFDNKWYGSKKVRTYLDDFDEAKILMLSRTLADSLGLESFIPFEGRVFNDQSKYHPPSSDGSLLDYPEDISDLKYHLEGIKEGFNGGFTALSDLICKIYGGIHGTDMRKTMKQVKDRVVNSFEDKFKEYIANFKKSVEQVRERTMDDKADSSHWRRERRELLQLLCKNFPKWPLYLDKEAENYILELPEKRRDSDYLTKMFTKNFTSNLTPKDTSVLKNVILPAIFKYDKEFYWLSNHRKWFNKERGMELATDVFNPLNYMNLAYVLPSGAIPSKFVKIIHPDEEPSNAIRSRDYHLQVDFDTFFGLEGLNKFTYELTNKCKLRELYTENT